MPLQQQYRQKKIKRILSTTVMLSSLVLGLFGYLQLEKYGYGLSKIGFKTANKENKYQKYLTESITYDVLSENVLGENTEVAKSVPVLIYHGIVEKITGDGDVLYEDFKSQMISLKQNGYETITLSELNDFLNNGKPVPKKSFVLTFDDGRKDSYYPVDPILKSLGYQATMFLIAGTIEDNDVYHLTRSEIKELLNTGRWEIGSHSEDGHEFTQVQQNGDKGHWLSNKLWLSTHNRLETDTEYADRITQDLANSKLKLEQEFGMEIKDFAFPFGDFGQNTTNYEGAKQVYLANVQSNYRLAYYQSWSELGNRNYPGVDTFLIRRISVDSSFKDSDLLNEMEDGQDKPIGFIDNFERNNGWTGNWGNIDNTEGGMRLTSDNSESGASAYLRGSETWDKYSLSIDVKVGDNVDTFSILTNVDRKNSYSYCNFSENGVSYNERVDGVVRSGKYWKHSLFYTFQKQFKAGIINDGRTISCLVNDKIVVQDDIRAKITQGMIGFSIWSKLNNAEAEIDNFVSTSLE